MAHQLALHADHVGDGDHREGKAVGSPSAQVGGRRPGGTHAATDDVSADAEVLGGVEPLPRAYHVVPPARLGIFLVVAAGGMGIARQRMAEQNGIGPIGIEGPVRLVGDGDGPNLLAAIQPQLVGRLKKLHVFGLDYAHASRLHPTDYLWVSKWSRQRLRCRSAPHTSRRLVSLIESTGPGH